MIPDAHRIAFTVVPPKHRKYDDQVLLDQIQMVLGSRFPEYDFTVTGEGMMRRELDFRIIPSEPFADATLIRKVGEEIGLCLSAYYSSRKN